MSQSFPSSISAVIVADQQNASFDCLQAVSQALAFHCADSEIIVVAKQVSSAQLLELKDCARLIPDLTVLFVDDRIGQATAQLIGIESAIHDWILLLTPTATELKQFGRLKQAIAEGFEVVGLTHAPPNREGLFGRLTERLTSWLYQRLAGVAMLPTAPPLLMMCREFGLYVTGQHCGELLLRSSRPAGGFPTKILQGVLDAQPKRADNRVALRHHLKSLFLSTRAPVRAATFAGMAGSMLCLSYSVYVLLVYMLRNDVQPGWTTLSMMVSIGLFLIFSVMGIQSEFVFQLLSDSAPRRRTAIRRELRSVHTRCSDRLNVVQDEFQVGAPVQARDSTRVAA